MSAKNPKTSCKVVTLHYPATLTATTTLNNTTPNLDVDTLGFTHALVIAVSGDNTTLITDTMTIQMKETSTAGSAYSDISGAAFSAITGTTGDSTTQQGEIYLQPRKRYLSATITEAGTFSGIITLVVVLFNAEYSESNSNTYAFSV